MLPLAKERTHYAKNGCVEHPQRYYLTTERAKQPQKTKGDYTMQKTIVSNWDKLPVLLSVEQTALIFDKTTVTIKHWLYDGKIKGIKTGKAWQINRDALRVYTETGAWPDAVISN